MLSAFSAMAFVKTVDISVLFAKFMTVGAMSLDDVFCNECSYAPPLILSWRYSLKMFWVDASSVSTKVVDFKACWYRPYLALIEESVGVHLLMFSFNSDIKNPVSATWLETVGSGARGLPYPTRFRSTASIHFGQKSFNIIQYFSHRDILISGGQ